MDIYVRVGYILAFVHFFYFFCHFLLFFYVYSYDSMDHLR